MERQVLKKEKAQLVVDGLLSGYKDYLEFRKDMKEKLEVSAGFAFTTDIFKR